MRKLISAVLVLTLLLSCCSALAETNKWGWEVPEEELSFTYFAAEQYASMDDLKEAQEKCDYAMDKFLKDEFNVVIEKSQSVQETAEWVSLSIVDNSYPDVISWLPVSDANTLIDAEVAIPLDDLLEKYGQTILAEVGDYIELCRSEDGHIYKMPVNYGPKIDQVGYAFSIRYDWWKELADQGKVTAYPATPEEWYEQMKMMIANHPTNDKGEKTYAVTACDKTGQNLLNTLLGAWGFYSGYDVDSENNLTYWLETDRAEEVVKFANKLWREGLIHPDFLSFDYDMAQTNAVDDRLAGNISTWWYMFTWGHEYWQEVDPSTPIEKRFVNLAVTADGVDHQSMASLGFLSGSYWVITDKCENPEAVVAWLNWESTPMGVLITTAGVPGGENIYDIVDGKVVFREESLDASKKNVEFHDRREGAGCQLYWIAARQSALTAGKSELPFELDPRVADTLGGWDVYPRNAEGTGYLDPGWDICWGAYDTDWVWDTTTLNNYTLTADNPLYDTNSYIKNYMEKMWVQMVCAESEEAALAALNEARAEIENAGVKDVSEFRTEAFKQNLETLNQSGIQFVNQK